MNITSVFERLLDGDALDISELEVTDQDLDALLPLADQIKELNLGESPMITMQGIKKLRFLNALERLRFFDLPLDDDGLLLLVNLFPKLTSLFFGGEAVTVTVEGLLVLARLPDLKEVLVDNQDYADALARTFPGLKVLI